MARVCRLRMSTRPPDKFDVRKAIHGIGAGVTALKSLPTIEGCCLGVLLKRCQRQPRWAEALSLLNEHLSYRPSLMLGRDKDLLQRRPSNVNSDEADYRCAEGRDTTDALRGDVVSQARQPCFVWHGMRQVWKCRMPRAKPNLGRVGKVGFTEVSDVVACHFQPPSLSGKSLSFPPSLLYDACIARPALWRAGKEEGQKAPPPANELSPNRRG